MKQFLTSKYFQILHHFTKYNYQKNNIRNLKKARFILESLFNNASIVSNKFYNIKVLTIINE